jgi:hypothetical protein
VLVVAGGAAQLRNAYILLRLLRHPRIACSLPAELVHYGPQELDAAAVEALLQHARDTHTQLSVLDGAALTQQAGAAGLAGTPHVRWPLRGFRAKVHALAWVTTFDQVCRVARVSGAGAATAAATHT